MYVCGGGSDRSTLEGRGAFVIDDNDPLGNAPNGQVPKLVIPRAVVANIIAFMRTLMLSKSKFVLADACPGHPRARGIVWVQTYGGSDREGNDRSWCAPGCCGSERCLGWTSRTWKQVTDHGRD